MLLQSSDPVLLHSLIVIKVKASIVPMKDAGWVHDSG